MLRILYFVILLIFTPFFSQGQEEREESFTGLGFSYGLDFPVGQLADRYGSNFNAQLSLDVFSIGLNGVFGIEGGVLFGEGVNEDVLSPFRSENGRIPGNNGELADVFLRQRGTILGAYINKIIMPRAVNKRSGVSLGLGVGLIQRKIRFVVDSQNVGQLTGDYIEGYDRNTVGPYLKESIKFQNFGKNKSVNYEIALNFTQGFTSNTRSINFDTGMADNNRNVDIMIGLSAKWFLPIFGSREPEEIFY